MTYPDLISTHEHYTLKSYTEPFTICSYRGGQVEVINKNTGELSLHDKEDFVKVVVTDKER